MTDYNDGKWHGWNGGECPVHPKSKCEFIYPAQDMQNESPYWSVGVAKPRTWGSTFLFRVVKPAPPKPREWWLCGRNFFPTKLDAQEWSATMHPDHNKIIRVIEVLP
jgi:hypothetical protein